MLKILCLIGVALLLHSCSSLNKKAGLKDDNFVEELLEQAIEEKTGLDLDLTPETKESP